ncbi:hypothetical protein HY490_04300 [Candidatus Woesearchaeota archaeon]|nr:hypothetical protein [Candidatus Woesearchaeota archaeon]
MEELQNEDEQSKGGVIGVLVQKGEGLFRAVPVRVGILSFGIEDKVASVYVALPHGTHIEHVEADATSVREETRITPLTAQAGVRQVCDLLHRLKGYHVVGDVTDRGNAYIRPPNKDLDLHTDRKNYKESLRVVMEPK